MIDQEVENETEIGKQEGFKTPPNQEENEIENQTPENENDTVDFEKQEKSKDEEILRLKDQYIRLLAEFDNFRKRTSRERVELIKTAGEDVISVLLPVLDDFERTIVAIQKTDNLASIRDGIRLVTENFFKALHKKGLVQIKSVGENFDSTVHEAITTISVEEEMKNKVVDEVEKGYRLHEKVIRFSKVVVGE